jgi:hypothetical protein
MTTMGAVLFDADGVIQRGPRDLHDRLTRLVGGTADAREAGMADIFAAEAPALVGEEDIASAHVEAAQAAGLHAAQFVLGDMGSGGPPLRALLATFGLATG